MTEVQSPIKQIIKRDGMIVPYDKDLITTAIFKSAVSIGGSDRATAESLSKQIEQALADTYGPGAIPTVEDIQDLVESTLINEGHAKTARAYIIYRHERAKLREARQTTFDAVENIPYKKVYDALCWNIDHGCDSIEGLNEIIKRGEFPDLVRAVTDRYDQEVAQGAEKIIDQLPDVCMVIVAGPSSSGKTTTTIKASEKLEKAGRRFKSIIIDHYFFDLKMHPKDEFGDYDYETPQALDLELINDHLVQLIEGKSIRTPDYDFKTGKRTLDVHEMSLAENEILLIDSLHGLYDQMTSGIPTEKKFRLYIETLGQIHNEHGIFMRWADNRLMRRMIRDSWHRNLKPDQTLTHWHYVRRSELQNIIPFIGTADYVVNSALPYELPILKHRLFKYFPEAMEIYKNEPKRQDAYIRAKRVYEFLDPMTEVADDTCVPSRALLREFIGGSEYEY